MLFLCLEDGVLVLKSFYEYLVKFLNIVCWFFIVCDFIGWKGFGNLMDYILCDFLICFVENFFFILLVSKGI